MKRSFYLADGDIYYITALSDPSQEKYAMILVIDEDIRTQAYAQFAAGRSLKSTVRRSLYQPVGLPTTDSQLRSFLHRLSILGWFVVSHALELRGMVSEVERGLDFEGPSITIVSKNAPHVTASLGPEILNKCLRLPPGEAAAIAYYRMVEQMVAQLGRISTSHL